jgi:hypothetical protein
MVRIKGAVSRVVGVLCGLPCWISVTSMKGKSCQLYLSAFVCCCVVVSRVEVSVVQVS